MERHQTATGPSGLSALHTEKQNEVLSPDGPIAPAPLVSGNCIGVRAACALVVGCSSFSGIDTFDYDQRELPHFRNRWSFKRRYKLED